MNRCVNILLSPNGERIEGRKGQTLLNAFWAAGIHINSACGSKGTCGKCRIRMNGCDDLPSESECRHLSSLELAQGVRLACQITLLEDISLELIGSPDKADQIKRAQAVVSISPGQELAFAVDIGTTNVNAELITIPEGKTICRNSTLNPQRAFGHDVVSRIQSAKNPANFQAMKKGIRGAITGLLRDAFDRFGVNGKNVSGMTISGNAVMLHLFFGLDISGMGKYPYQSPSLEAFYARAMDLGFDELDRADISGLPSIASYLGGDLVAGILSTGMHKKSNGSSLLLDIGTNSEMVIVHKGKMAATSCAAGPAFEGMNIECGMTAVDGAIEGVELTDDIDLKIIGGDVKPLGICGSGIIELMAEMRRTGILDAEGRMIPGKSGQPMNLRRKMMTYKGASAISLSDHVVFTQKDARQIQLAKAAILSGLRALSASTAVLPAMIDRVYIAGEFGKHLRVDHLVRLGILDCFPNAAYEFIGNSSLSGAKMAAMDPEMIFEASEIVNRVASFPLSVVSGYDRLFMQALNFPDPWQSCDAKTGTENGKDKNKNL